MYRMPRDFYYKLLYALIEDGCRFPRTVLSSKVSMIIRWLAGDSYLDVCASHRLPVSSLFAICGEMIRLLSDGLVIKFDVRNVEEHDKQSRAFGRGVSTLAGWVGAIYGLAIKIEEPRGRDTPNPSRYYHRKGFFAIAVQAMCDASYRFIF
jgi:hypothetical protein